jgi:hypothetical protein
VSQRFISREQTSCEFRLRADRLHQRHRRLLETLDRPVSARERNSGASLHAEVAETGIDERFADTLMCLDIADSKRVAIVKHESSRYLVLIATTFTRHVATLRVTVE